MGLWAVGYMVYVGCVAAPDPSATYSILSQAEVWYVAECVVKRQSLFVESDRGRRTQQRMWREMRERLQRVDTETAGLA